MGPEEVLGVGPGAATPSLGPRASGAEPGLLRQFGLHPVFGSAVMLIVFAAIFSLSTHTFLTATNLSLVVQQSVITGAVAIGQTIIILTAGIDLANGAICVLGTIVAGKLVDANMVALLALLIAIALCTASGAVSGALVSKLGLPPFIITLGMLGIVTAGTRLISQGGAFPVTDPLLSWSGNAFRLGPAPITYGTLILGALYLIVWYALTQTAWGTHVYALGNSPEAARLVGIPVQRHLLSVYTIAGLIYGIAAWLALGRIPNADPNALQTANLDSITAVVIGGTSLFGGRGSLWGTLIGTLIVSVLRNGLTLEGIDPLWQDLVTGVLVIAAVAFDELSRRRRT